MPVRKNDPKVEEKSLNKLSKAYLLYKSFNLFNKSLSRPSQRNCVK